MRWGEFIYCNNAVQYISYVRCRKGGRKRVGMAVDLVPMDSIMDDIFYFHFCFTQSVQLLGRI